MKSVLLILTILILSSCAPNQDKITLNTGPEVEILNIVEVGLTVDTNGDFVLKGEVSLPTPIHTEILDVNWNVGFEKVLYEAADKTNYLYIVWQDENDKTHEEAYNIGKPFRISFEREDWVKNISNTDTGTIVVAVEKQKLLAESSWQPAQDQLWSNIVSVRMPSLNDIRKDLISIWDANQLNVDDISSPGSRTYNGIANPNQEYLWPYYWCTRDKKVLEENLTHIRITFFVDDEIVPKDSVFYYHYDTNTNWYCGYWATVVGGWPRGDTLEMKLEYTFDADVNDGAKSYPAGSYIHRLLIDIPK